MSKDRAAQQRLFSGTILRGLTQPLNAYDHKYFPLLLLLLLPIFVVPADLSQQAKSAAADGNVRLAQCNKSYLKSALFTFAKEALSANQGQAITGRLLRC
jgi:hypothetical protein